MVIPFQEGTPLHEAETPITQDPSREIFMAIITEIQELDDDPMARVDLVDYNSSDYDKFLFDDEMDTTISKPDVVMPSSRSLLWCNYLTLLISSHIGDYTTTSTWPH